jgi:hypothetical protein
MRFHPVISIIIGTIVSFLLYLIVESFFGLNNWVTFIIIFIYILGGLIAVFFAKENKIQYALYEGIFITFIIVLLMFISSSYLSTIFNYVIIIISFSMIGGLIALLMNKNYNGLNSYYAILMGSIIGYSCMTILYLIVFSPDHNNLLSTIIFVIGIVSFVIGGSLSVFLAKEKKLQYGIYTGIIIIILGLLGLQPSLMYKLPVIHFVAVAIYLISAVVGSYLTILVIKSKQ